MSATAGQAADGVRSLADRFGIEPGMVVMEMGYDDDVDQDLRDALTDRCGELVDEDTLVLVVSDHGARPLRPPAIASVLAGIFLPRARASRGTAWPSAWRNDSAASARSTTASQPPI